MAEDDQRRLAQQLMQLQSYQQPSQPAPTTPPLAPRPRPQVIDPALQKQQIMQQYQFPETDDNAPGWQRPIQQPPAVVQPPSQQPPQHSGPIPPPQQPPQQPPAQPQPARFGWPGGQSGGGGFYPLNMPAAPQPLDMPPPPPGLNQLVGTPSGGSGQPTITDPRNMPVFQGFPGPFPGDNQIPTGGTPQERALARIDSLALPPDVLARLRATLTGQPLPGTNTGTGTGGTGGGTGGTGTGGSTGGSGSAGAHDAIARHRGFFDNPRGH